MMDWSSFREDVANTIKEMGKQMTVRRHLARGVFDPVTGTYAESQYEEFIVDVVNVSSQTAFVRGLVISYNDNTFIVAAGDLYTPQVGDVFIDGEYKRDVMKVITVRPASVDLLHQVELAP